MEIEIPDNLATTQDKYPFPAPFILSSVERYKCMNDAAKITFVKRRHLEENLKTIEAELGMDEAERKRFLDYWCQPANRDPSEILAEVIPAFELRQRATTWMERKRPQRHQQPSRAEQYAESARQFLSGSQQEIPRPGSRPPAGGYADIPDEQ